MGRRKNKHLSDAGQVSNSKDKGQQHHDEGLSDPPSAVLAVHPTGDILAVASGSEIRVCNLRLHQVQIIKAVAEGPMPDRNFVRGLAFDAAGNYLLAGCDNKQQGLLLWDCSTWEQINTVKVPKKVSAVAISRDGHYILAADKFGDINIILTEQGPTVTPRLLLGHFNSMLTSVSVSHCGKYVVSTDRDGKARVSVLPLNPMEGAHEIQSFCLGHTSFVTCSAFLSQGGQELLVTGGADGTVRLWDHISGKLLSTWNVPQQPEEESNVGQHSTTRGHTLCKPINAQILEDGEVQESGVADFQDVIEDADRASAVLSVATSHDGCWVAAALENRDDIALIPIDIGTQTLGRTEWRVLEGLHLPTQVAFSHANRLWAVGGPPVETSSTAFLSYTDINRSGDSSSLPDDIRAKLEARDGSEVAALAACVEARRQHAARINALQRKRKYGRQEMQNRKLCRRDVRAKIAGIQQ